ncbi:MAG: DUF3501 family protein [Leptonema sp. (in: bacteria)]
MKKIQFEEILPVEEYNKKRNEFREKIFAIKNKRRFHLGTMFTFLFENRDTVWYQIQEMIRAENIKEKDAILHEIQTYNELIPEEREIKATLLIEIDDKEFRKYKLKELLGLEKSVFFFYLDKEKTYEIPALFDEKQYNKERISSVQYLTFRFSEEEAKAFLETKKAGIKVTHPAYFHSGFFDPEQLMAIQKDFSNA